MTEITFSQLVLYFTAYSVIGWICETVWCSVGDRKFVNRGFLGGPWCPVYGFGAVIILFFVESLRDYPALVFLLAMLSTSLLEYFTGWLLEVLFKTRWWDYANNRFNIKGRVCLLNSLMFGLMGLALVYLVHPPIDRLIDYMAGTTQRVLASIMAAALLLDLLRSLAALANLDERLKGIRESLEALKEHQRAAGIQGITDISERIRHLRDTSRRQPENEAAAGILQRLEHYLVNNKSGERLIKAFPKLKSMDFDTEVAVLKQEMEKRLRDNRRKAGRLWASVKEKLNNEKQAVKQSYKGITLTRMIWVFLTGCVAGYVLESLYCLVINGYIESRQGMVYGPFSQIYGFGAVLMALILSPFAHRGKGWLFVGGAVVGGVFEAACSLVQEYVFGTVSWGYSERVFPLFGGRTSLLYMIFWGVLAVVYMKGIYPRMTNIIDRIFPRAKRFFTCVIVIFLAADMALSGIAVARWAGRAMGEPPENAVEAWLDEKYPDEMLREIYPNMIHVGLEKKE